MRLVTILLFASLLPWSVQAAEDCGDLSNGYGPYDYRSEKGRTLWVVESMHFDSNVDNLIKGKSGPLGGDIDYTLRAYPNHHRALMSMERLVTRVKTPKPHGASYTMACYFDRAIRFRPDDATVRMLYGNYLAKQGKPNEALQQLQAAEKTVGENANLHYNMGLVYVALKDYGKALDHAHRAYQMGFPLPGLRNMLERAGKWQEPQKTPASVQTSPQVGEPLSKPPTAAPDS